MIQAMSGNILAKIPLELAEAVNAGSAERVGMIVRDTATKKILGHLQETSLTQTLAGRVLDSAGGVLSAGIPLNPLSAAGELVTIYQNEQMKQQLDTLLTMMGGMQAMQIATLVTSVAGIGVTVASTMMILNRLKRVEGRLDEIADKIDAVQRESQDDEIRTTIARIETYLERLAEADHSRDPERDLRSAEEDLHLSFADLSRRTSTVFARERLDPDFLFGILSALALCSGAQIRSLVWLGEMERAQRRATSQAHAMNEIAFALPRDVLNSKLGNEVESAERIDQLFSELRMRAASLPSFINTLSAHGVEGRDYFRVAAEEETESLLILPPASSTA